MIVLAFISGLLLGIVMMLAFTIWIGSLMHEHDH